MGEVEANQVQEAKEEQAKVDSLKRQEERDEFAHKAMVIINALRQQENWDARGADKIEITIPADVQHAVTGQVGGQPQAIVHSRIHPSFPFSMPLTDLNAEMAKSSDKKDQE